MNFGSIINCYSVVTINNIVQGFIGGICGSNFGDVQKCYANLSVNSSVEAVGTIVGSNNGMVANCVAIGNLIMSNHGYIGDVVGAGSENVNNVYCQTSMRHPEYLYSYKISWDGITISNENLKLGAFYSIALGWSPDVWYLDGNDIPKLKWQVQGIN